MSTLSEGYREDLEVTVYITLEDGGTENVFHSKIDEDMEYNSWFYVHFENTVFLPKGAECAIDIRSSNFYQRIPFAHIRENIEKAEKCAEFAEFDLNLFEWIGFDYYNEEICAERSLEHDGDYLFCLKSLSVVPVDEKERLDL